jgi:hypothetical protein
LNWWGERKSAAHPGEESFPLALAVSTNNAGGAVQSRTNEVVDLWIYEFGTIVRTKEKTVCSKAL